MLKVYFFVDRLIHLLLTFHVSIITTTKVFSTMKIRKTKLSNKIEDEFLTDNLVVYIEREITEIFDSKFVLEDFISLKTRHVQL